MTHRTTTAYRLCGLSLAGALAITGCTGAEESAPASPSPTDPGQVDAADPTTEPAPTTAAPVTEQPQPDQAAATTAGDDGVPALADIWDDVLANTQSAESVTAMISGPIEGQRLQADLRGRLDDSNYQVDLQLDDAAASIIGDDGDYFINGDAGYWELAAGPDTAPLADQWVVLPEDGQGIAEQFGMSAMWSGFLGTLPTDEVQMQTSSEQLTELDGVPAYHYSVATEDAEIWISADGQERLLRLLVDEGTPDQMEVVATDWDSTEPVDPPEDARTVEEIVGG